MQSDDINAQIKQALLDDDASKYKSSLSFEQRRAMYSKNGLVERELALTSDERATVRNFMTSDRPGYDDAIKDALG